MQTWKEFKPTGFDPPILFHDHRDDWFTGLGIARDSDPKYQRRWKQLEARLLKLDPEKKEHEFHRFGHWGMGWFEVVIAAAGSKCYEELEALEAEAEAEHDG